MGLVRVAVEGCGRSEASLAEVGPRQAVSSPQGQRFCEPPSCQRVIGSRSLMADDLVRGKETDPRREETAADREHRTSRGGVELFDGGLIVGAC